MSTPSAYSGVRRMRRTVVDKFIAEKHKSISIRSMNLQWIPYAGNAAKPHHKSSKAWDFMGQLIQVDRESEDAAKPFEALFSDLLYCKMCFDEQMEADRGTLAKVYCTSKATSTGNHLSHAAGRHGKHFEKESKIRFETTSNVSLDFFDQQPPIAGILGNQFDTDAVLMTSFDLQPFAMLENAGLRSFSEKYTSFELPSKQVAISTLIDVYGSLKAKVIEMLSSCVSGSLMLDVWMDRSHSRHFIAIRISFVREWSFKTLTLSVQPVDSHAAVVLTPAVKDVMSEFLPASRQYVFFNTSSDAANMKSLSRVLGLETVTCIAHAIHLLLTVDSLSQVVEVEQLLVKCKEIIHVLHFNGHLAANEECHMFDKVMEVQEILFLDESDPVSDENNLENQVQGLSKASIPSRWTAMLVMTEVILDQCKLVCDVLKRIGRSDLSLNAGNLELLTQLHSFLKPFEQFNLLVNECSPNLSLVPLIRTRIQKMCQTGIDSSLVAVSNDSLPMMKVKQLVSLSLDKRLPLTSTVKLIVCFDPAVRDAVLPRAECEEILTQAYNRLRLSGLSDVFASAEGANGEGFDSSPAQNSDNKLDSDSAAAVAAKKLRLELLMESSSSSSSLPDCTAVDEIRRYLAIHDEAPALEFWQRNADGFPLLSVMARIYLAISPGSVRCENLFSTTGLLLNNKRSQLAPYLMNMVSFVHDNCNSFA